jgi:hypothetical protein
MTGKLKRGSVLLGVPKAGWGELGAGRGGLCGCGAVSGRMGRGGKGPLIRGQ